MDDMTQLRRRIEAVSEEISQLRRPAPPSDAVVLGRVVNRGNMPTTVPGMFAVDIMTSDGAIESEGIFLVLGPAVPEVGDGLLARLVAGLWVAQRSGVTAAVVITVIVRACPGFESVRYATVTLKLDGETISSGVTDIFTLGNEPQVTLTTAGPGSYVIEVEHESYPTVTSVAYEVTGVLPEFAYVFMTPCGALPSTLSLSGDDGTSVTLELQVDALTETPDYLYLGYKFCPLNHGSRYNPGHVVGPPFFTDWCDNDQAIEVRVTFTFQCVSLFGEFVGFSLTVTHQADSSGYSNFTHYEDLEAGHRCPEPGATLVGASAEATATIGDETLVCEPFNATCTLDFNNGGWVNYGPGEEDVEYVMGDGASPVIFTVTV